MIESHVSFLCCRLNSRSLKVMHGELFVLTAEDDDPSPLIEPHPWPWLLSSLLMSLWMIKIFSDVLFPSLPQLLAPVINVHHILLILAGPHAVLRRLCLWHRHCWFVSTIQCAHQGTLIFFRDRAYGIPQGNARSHLGDHTEGLRRKCRGGVRVGADPWVEILDKLEPV